jgi:hypothetical protein
LRLLKKERNKQARKRKQEREKQTKKQARSKQKEKGKQANQEASKQTLPHVLGFGRYPLSHKPSRPSKREAKKKARSRSNPNYPRLTRGRRPYPFSPTNVSHYKQPKKGEK